MSRPSILIVEDESIIAQDLSEMLSEFGYEVLGVASTGHRAVEVALHSRPDLVLMDVRLEGDLDGISAAAKIRESTGAPVIFLTAYADDITLERAKAAEPFGYLVKPIVERELNSTIQVAWHRWRLEKARDGAAFLPDLLEGLGGGYYRLDHAWRFVDVSPEAERLFDAQRDALLGQSIWEAFPELHDAALGEELRGVSERGAEVVLDTFHLPAGVWVRMHARPVPDGIVVYFFATPPGRHPSRS